jgi:NAD(P)H dehydrogenase (quinone)
VSNSALLRQTLVIWLYPIWWGGMQAILKGWFDRVVAYGFAYSDGRRYDTGFFKEKRGILCLTTGGTEARFSATGIYGTIYQLLWPVQRLMVEYLGMEALEPFVAYAAPRVDQATREAYLDAWRADVDDRRTDESLSSGTRRCGATRLCKTKHRAKDV